MTRTVGVVLAFVMGALTAEIACAAPPVLDDAWLDTEQDTPLDVFVDFQIISASEDLDYSTITFHDQPFHGDLDVDDVLGVITYTPDEGFFGFDAFSYTVRDLNQEESNVAWVFVYVERDGEWLNSAPLIVDFRVIKEPGDLWSFVGKVLDENPEGMMITFGGVLEGESTEVLANGDFFLTISLASTVQGVVTAETVDEYDAASNIVADYVNQN